MCHRTRTHTWWSCFLCWPPSPPPFPSFLLSFLPSFLPSFPPSFLPSSFSFLLSFFPPFFLPPQYRYSLDGNPEMPFLFDVISSVRFFFAILSGSARSKGSFRGFLVILDWFSIYFTSSFLLLLLLMFSNKQHSCSWDPNPGIDAIIFVYFQLPFIMQLVRNMDILVSMVTCLYI